MSHGPLKLSYLGGRVACGVQFPYALSRVCARVKPLESQGPFGFLSGGSGSLRETRAKEDVHAVPVQPYRLLTAPGHLSAAGGSHAVGPRF